MEEKALPPEQDPRNQKAPFQVWVWVAGGGVIVGAFLTALESLRTAGFWQLFPEGSPWPKYLAATAMVLGAVKLALEMVRGQMKIQQSVAEHAGNTATAEAKGDAEVQRIEAKRIAELERISGEIALVKAQTGAQADP